ncbi:unnamed protein product, partial [Phaeothamnion confervicola]
MERRQLSATRAPERIVLCVDMGDEMNDEWAISPEAPMQSRQSAVQNALKTFVRRKLSFRPGPRGHKFAVVGFADEAEWRLNFTDNLEQIFQAIDGLTARRGCEPTFDFSRLFEALEDRLGLGSEAAIPAASPGRTRTLNIRLLTRVIVVFGRSIAAPKL